MKGLEAQQVLDRCATGEERAWQDLYQEYCPVAACFLRRLGVAAAELDDACQEVFVQVFRYLDRFERRADFRTWLYRICISQASRVRRRKRVREAQDWLLGRQPTSIRPAAMQPEWSETAVAMRVAEVLDRMKPIHREVFVLFELEGMEGDEIGRILRCPYATLRRRLHYARAEFAKLLCAEPEEASS